MEQLLHFCCSLLYFLLGVSDVKVVTKVLHIHLNVVRLFLRLMWALLRRIRSGFTCFVPKVCSVVGSSPQRMFKHGLKDIWSYIVGYLEDKGLFYLSSAWGMPSCGVSWCPGISQGHLVQVTVCIIQVRCLSSQICWDPGSLAQSSCPHAVYPERIWDIGPDVAVEMCSWGLKAVVLAELWQTFVPFAVFISVRNVPRKSI